MLSVEYRPGCTYCPIAPFHPAKAYPEYSWPDSLSQGRTNDGYDMLRTSLLRLGLDQQHFGTTEWNPLGAFIKPGMTVLLKPNMVLNWHPSQLEGSLDSIITHPSLVRAAIDYVAIAIKGNGAIVVGDAPLQSCDFNMLINTQGYIGIKEFYASKGIDIFFVDFRQIASVYDNNHILKTTNINGDPAGYITVDMLGKSAHVPIRQRASRFRVTNYDHNKMALYHTESFNKYLIAATPLLADVVITLPKVKVHRKAGMTGALKSFVGIIGHKDCLPHHTRNSAAEGGDEYRERNPWKRRSAICLEWMNVLAIRGQSCLANWLQRLARYCWGMGCRRGADPFAEGSWYGNDTIWRTILDLARIIVYADKQGVLQGVPQRKVFVIGDALVSGEGEGPLQTTPKASCFLAVGDDLPVVDYALSVIMGLEPEKIPSVREAFAPHPLPLTSDTPSAIDLRSNNKAWNGEQLPTMSVSKSLHFVVPAHWKGHVERQG